MEPFKRKIVDEKYYYFCNVKSDINEHLPTLKKYSEECESILELGVRWVVASWAFLMGKPKKFYCMDIVEPLSYGVDINILKLGAEEKNIEFNFILGNDLNPLIYNNLPNFDLIFIDTDHTYEQVSNELNIYHKLANKYIILHDTISFRYGGFNGDSKGIWLAITEFLNINSDWELWESYSNNNGLTILKRKN